MNRRSFFTKLGLAATTLAILPSAATYARRWVSPAVSNRAVWIPNPEWVNAPYELASCGAIESKLTWEYLNTLQAQLLPLLNPKNL